MSNISIVHSNNSYFIHCLCRVELEDIMDKFWHLHSRVYESLHERNVPVDRLVAHLLSLRAFDPVYKDSPKPTLQSFFQELRNTESIGTVLFIIGDYFSFFNYRVIKHIVNGLGTNQDKVVFHLKMSCVSVEWRKGACSLSSRYPHLCNRRYFHFSVSRRVPWQQRVLSD